MATPFGMAGPSRERPPPGIPGTAADGTMSGPRPDPRRPRRPPPPPMPNPLLVPDDVPVKANDLMFQAFEWYCPADTRHWRRLKRALPSLAHLGVTSIWIPPATKGSSPNDHGYEPYDLYDLGEFDQKGTTYTRWGSKEELLDLVDTARRFGVGVLFDAVLNHKAGADFPEEVIATEVRLKDRTSDIGKPKVIKAWTGFDFPGRGGAYSTMRWGQEHFTGIDFDELADEAGIWRFQGKAWAPDVSDELGNYDYLMFADIDHTRDDVRADLFRWTGWLRSQLGAGLRGLRLDAVKHYSRDFVRALLSHIRAEVDPGWFAVGEYWSEESAILADYIDHVGPDLISLFDARLTHNFSRLSLSDEPDLGTLFDEALILYKPDNAVTFVYNHDTQFRQSLERLIAPYFVPIAYALILLRANAGLPCVFYADLYGTLGPPGEPGERVFHHFQATKKALCPAVGGGNLLPRLMLARRLWAYGTQVDYFGDDDDSSTAPASHAAAHARASSGGNDADAKPSRRPVLTAGFTRLGHPSQSRGDGLAVLMTCGWEHASKKMYAGIQHARETWTDVTRFCPGEVEIDENGWGTFMVPPRSVSVWVRKEADGRQAVEGFVFDWDIYDVMRAGPEWVPQGVCDASCPGHSIPPRPCQSG